MGPYAARGPRLVYVLSLPSHVLPALALLNCLGDKADVMYDDVTTPGEHDVSVQCDRRHVGHYMARATLTESPLVICTVILFYCRVTFEVDLQECSHVS